MKKIVKLSESDLKEMIHNVIEEQNDTKTSINELETSPTYREHWEHKFEKSAQILLKLGHSPDELSNKIRKISGSLPLNENFKVNGHEFNVIKFAEGTIYVGEDGILGDNRIIIPWSVINKLMKKYKHL